MARLLSKTSTAALVLMVWCVELTLQGWEQQRHRMGRPGGALLEHRLGVKLRDSWRQHPPSHPHLIGLHQPALRGGGLDDAERMENFQAQLSSLDLESLHYNIGKDSSAGAVLPPQISQLIPQLGILLSQ